MFRFIWTLVKLVVGLALAAGLMMLSGTVFREVSEQAATVAAIAGGLFGLWLFVARPLRRRRREDDSENVPASVVGIERVPPPGAPWYYHTYVTFDNRGRRIKVHLTKAQAKQLFDGLSVGDVGHLRHVGSALVSWQPASSRLPVETGSPRAAAAPGPTIFLSYAHEWADDAAYLEEFFRSRGFQVWMDDRKLRFGDRLRDEVVAAIRGARFFVPLLSPEYWTSEWCIAELDAAADAGCRVVPLKVTDRQLVMPPHVRRLYKEKLGDPAYLDLRGRNPVPRLEELVGQLRSSA